MIYQLDRDQQFHRTGMTKIWKEKKKKPQDTSPINHGSMGVFFFFFFFVCFCLLAPPLGAGYEISGQCQGSE